MPRKTLAKAILPRDKEWARLSEIIGPLDFRRAVHQVFRDNPEYRWIAKRMIRTQTRTLLLQQKAVLRALYDDDAMDDKNRLLHEYLEQRLQALVAHGQLLPTPVLIMPFKDGDDVAYQENWSREQLLDMEALDE